MAWKFSFRYLEFDTFGKIVREKYKIEDSRIKQNGGNNE